ncbi:MAG: ZapG family protein [Succinivibrio sp.]
MNSYLQLGLCLGAGFVVGALVCYLIMARIYKHKRVKDELLKTKRSAIRAQRTLDRFLKNSLDLFSDLNEVHTQYAQFLKDTAEMISPKDSQNLSFKTTAFSEKSHSAGIISQNRKTVATDPVLGALSEIPTPNVLKSPKIKTEPDNVEAAPAVSEKETKLNENNTNEEKI